MNLTCSQKARRLLPYGLVLVVIVVVVQVFLLCLSLFFKFRRIKNLVDEEKSFSKNYRYLRYNSNDESSQNGIVKLRLDLDEYISYDDGNGVYFLISDMSQDQYYCTGKCFLDETNVFSDNFVHLFPASDLNFANELSNNHFIQKCSETGGTLGDVFCDRPEEEEYVFSNYNSSIYNHPRENCQCPKCNRFYYNEDMHELCGDVCDLCKVCPDCNKKMEDEEKERNKGLKLRERYFLCEAHCVPNRELSYRLYHEEALQFGCEKYNIEGWVTVMMDKKEFEIDRHPVVIEEFKKYHGECFDHLCSYHTKLNVDVNVNMCVSDTKNNYNFQCYESFGIPTEDEFFRT